MSSLNPMIQNPQENIHSSGRLNGLKQGIQNKVKLKKKSSALLDVKNLLPTNKKPALSKKPSIESSLQSIIDGDEQADEMSDYEYHDAKVCCEAENSYGQFNLDYNLTEVEMKFLCCPLKYNEPDLKVLSANFPLEEAKMMYKEPTILYSLDSSLNSDDFDIMFTVEAPEFAF